MEQRLDVFLFLKGFAESREKAKQLIVNDSVYVNNNLINKPSAKISDDSIIVINNKNKYVGRGAIKLEKAIEYFNLNVQNKICTDIGASTGGFTECLLLHGASKVYAVDVGHDQLHHSLKSNEKVINHEGINFRYVDTEIFKEKIDIITVDVSFISLIILMPKIVEISHETSDIVVLIKPQFEAGKNNIGKNGIIKDKKIHLTVLNNINEYCLSNNLFIDNITFSPVKGGNGNIEYLALIKKGKKEKFENNIFKSLINEAFESL
ncbi:MAG: putative ribosomal methyltransferase [Bacillota bacterium]|jgi:23S rRNA (cytidine1920-2'-O)/16S rRNA (cytidine1409-2'-O)-methyltransferase|nr:putative ribosomal methyltransferase [Bacillota bacterium]